MHLGQPVWALNKKKKFEQVKIHRLLGVTLDQELNWGTHIKNICSKISKNIHLLSKLKHFLTDESRKVFFYSHIMSYINYACSLWDESGNNHLKRLRSLYRRAI